MHAVEFHTKITDGKIDIPTEYLQDISSDVKIIILYENPITISEKVLHRGANSIKGIINKYANPELMSIEKEAWGEAVKDKYATKELLKNNLSIYACIFAQLRCL